MTVLCSPQLGQGTAVLRAQGLADLDLSCGNGWVLTDLQIGFPSERPVVRSRSLADGVIDQSTYVGQRAVTATLTLDNRVATTQSLVDLLMPFVSPRRRPTLTWSLPGSATDFRQLTLRGVDAPLVIERPRYTIITVSWVSEQACMVDPIEQCLSVDPNDPADEIGREYDLDFDRDYVGIVPVGGVLVPNSGTCLASWTITLTASMVDPIVTVNGVQMAFTQNGGLTLVTGQTLVIDQQERTVLLNNDPNESRYDRLNFEDWNWDDLALQPGPNIVRLQGSGFTSTSLMTICWRSAWL
jgi:hypothetical protein